MKTVTFAHLQVISKRYVQIHSDMGYSDSTFFLTLSFIHHFDTFPN